MVASYMLGYGIGAFAVGPLRQLGDLSLSDVYLGAVAIAVVLILLANLLVRGARATTRGIAASQARR
ncbi:MAG: hypothetical protein IPK66_09525 [Rhodospirillales bacterium]|nr:hypothetical protein [Rhodospirillales bacterium]